MAQLPAASGSGCGSDPAARLKTLRCLSTPGAVHRRPPNPLAADIVINERTIDL